MPRYVAEPEAASVTEVLVQQGGWEFGIGLQTSRSVRFTDTRFGRHLIKESFANGSPQTGRLCRTDWPIRKRLPCPNNSPRMGNPSIPR
jgi:hypothetical protein